MMLRGRRRRGWNAAERRGSVSLQNRRARRDRPGQLPARDQARQSMESVGTTRSDGRRGDADHDIRRQVDWTEV